jgi:hypothetical protein
MYHIQQGKGKVVPVHAIKAQGAGHSSTHSEPVHCK